MDGLTWFGIMYFRCCNCNWILVVRVVRTSCRESTWFSMLVYGPVIYNQRKLEIESRYESPPSDDHAPSEDQILRQKDGRLTTTSANPTKILYWQEHVICNIFSVHLLYQMLVGKEVTCRWLLKLTKLAQKGEHNFFVILNRNSLAVAKLRNKYQMYTDLRNKIF
jgi:hypothetical protein